MSKAVQTSYTDSQLDEMVQLCSIEQQQTYKYPPPEGVRRVFFKTLEEVPVVLSTGPLRAEAKEFVPGAMRAKAAEEESKAVAEEVDQQPVEQNEADVTDLIDSRDIVDSLPSTAAPLVAESISQEQKDVAMRFLSNYRQRTRNQKLEKNKTSTQKICDSYFDTCLKLALDPEKMQWPYGFYYRKMYLGLVPHLLACVKGVESYAFSAKEKAKKRYRGHEKQDLDGIHKRTNEIV